MLLLERITGETGRMYALRTLKKNIITTDLKPGTLLSEKDLADEMGLSRTPVREAIIELANNQIIEVLPQRGSRVSLINMNLVEESGFCRLTMEQAIIKPVCDMITREQIIELEASLKMQEFYLGSSSTEKLMELDNQFHKYLYQICNKMQCYDLVSRISVHFDRVRQLALTSVKDLKIVEDHQALVAAISNHDVTAAQKIVHKHLTRFQIDESAIRLKYPDYFM